MPAEWPTHQQVDCSQPAPGIFLQKPPDPAVFQAIKVKGADNNVYVEHNSLSGATQSRMKVVGGYLRNSDHIFDRDGGKELWLNCARTLHKGGSGKKRKKGRGSVGRRDGKEVHAAAMQTATDLMRESSEAAKRATTSGSPLGGDDMHWTVRDEKARALKRETDPFLWNGAPWRSLHDGLCTTTKLQFKWNQPGPKSSQSTDIAGKPLNHQHFRDPSRRAATCVSIQRSDYQAHARPVNYSDPTNYAAQAKPRTWDYTISRLNQPHETRHYRQKPARARPELSPMQWARKKFSSEGNGSSG